jgi:hypothetical protein
MDRILLVKVSYCSCAACIVLCKRWYVLQPARTLQLMKSSHRLQPSRTCITPTSNVWHGAIELPVTVAGACGSPWCVAYVLLVWFTVSSEQRLVVNTTYLSVQKDYDILSIFETCQHTMAVARYSGSSIPPPLVMPGLTVCIKFTSDSSVTLSGFVLSIDLSTPAFTIEYFLCICLEACGLLMSWQALPALSALSLPSQAILSDQDSASRVPNGL